MCQSWRCWRCWLFIFTFFSVFAYPQATLRAPVIPDQPWDAVPGPNATGHLIFQSVASLLQHWPNTKYRNGHTIIAASIPPGTLLYHGRRNVDFLFDRPEWLATDPEHAYIFCEGFCQLFSFVATRKLQLAYFDGSSAAKMMSGTMDSQDILIWGEVRPERCWEERLRIKDACILGKQYGLDGFVRMEMDFEIMLCDFYNGVKLVSNSSVVIPQVPQLPKELDPPIIDSLSSSPSYDMDNTPPPGLDPPFPFPFPFPDPVVPDGWRGSLRSISSTLFEVLNSGSWHNHVPGETRIRVDYSRLVSFFDPALTSLVAVRMNKTRGKYRIEGISPEDAKDVRDQLVDIFTRDGEGSGIDWGSVANIIVKRYSGRLKLTRHLIEPSKARNVTEQAYQVRAQVLTMLTPYMLVAAIPPNTTAVPDRSWIAPIVGQCASSLTSWAEDSILTRQEKVVKLAIDEVQHEICRVLGEIWLDAFDVERATPEETRPLLAKWSNDIDGLMTWLDWSVWDACKPECGPEHICYLPTWPWLSSLEIGEEQTDMSPGCVSVIKPFDFQPKINPSSA